MNKDYFRNLCIKDLSKNINEQEKVELNNWLSKDEHNKVEYKQLKRAWIETKPNQLEYEINIDSEWDRFNEKTIINYAEPKRSKMKKIINLILRPKLKPSLAFGSALILVISLFLFNNFDEEQILQTVITKNGERLELVLSDGSIINMNNGSEINYYENFSDEKRVITLNGEAFFSIKKDGRPFIIKTENATTTVLGTKFNVWARENKTRVIVKEGKVSLADDIVLDQKVILEKNQTSVVIGNDLPLEAKNINAEYRLGWLEDKIVFNNTNLTEVVRELERYYDTTINIEENIMNELSLTGTFENEKVDTVLSKICLALNLKYLERENKFKITK